MITIILQGLIVDIIGNFVKDVLVAIWKRVVDYFSENPFDFLPFILVQIVFPALSVNLPHTGDLFQILLFFISLGLCTIASGLIGAYLKYQGIQELTFG